MDPSPRRGPLAGSEALGLPFLLQGAVCPWSLGRPLCVHSDEERTTLPSSRPSGTSACRTRQRTMNPLLWTWEVKTRTCRGGKQDEISRKARRNLKDSQESPDLKLFSSPPLWQLRPLGRLRVLSSRSTLDRTRSPRGTRRSPAAWEPVRMRPAPPSGSEPLNLRRQRNAALRKGGKPLLEKRAHAFPKLRSSTAKGNQRQTDTQTPLH